MNSPIDKLSRISALRPASARSPAMSALSSSTSGAEKLVQMLKAECRINRLGRHVIVRRRFAQSQACELKPRAFRLITTGAVDSICDLNQWLFLDTETTGLAGGTGTYAFLVGVGWWENNGLTVEQYFMRDHSEEPSLLLELSQRLAQRRVLVTFNGKSYDWPLLQTRYRMARTGIIQEPAAHIDLLHPARQLWQLRLKSITLCELERHVLQLDRGHDILSETIPQKYFDFLRGGPPEPIAEIFYHNQMDLYGLASLAVHVSRILADPENADCGADELFGISRLLQRRGKDQLAGKIYLKALEGGLPEAAEKIAQRELAILSKRRRDFTRSNMLWEKLIGDTSDGLKAYEQLAIYYEHRARQLQKAASLSREALVKLQQAFHEGRIATPKYRQWHASFQHRLNRLTTKIEGERWN